jgi:hypothetical protein
MTPRMLERAPGQAARCHLYDPTIADRPGLDAMQRHGKDIGKTIVPIPETEAHS